MADANQITDDDWAAAMQEQAAAETGDSEADRVAAELAAAAMGDSPYQARPASQRSNWLAKAWRSRAPKTAGPPVCTPAPRSSSMKLRMDRRWAIESAV